MLAHANIVKYLYSLFFGVRLISQSKFTWSGAQKWKTGVEAFIQSTHE